MRHFRDATCSYTAHTTSHIASATRNTLSNLSNSISTPSFPLVTSGQQELTYSRYIKPLVLRDHRAESDFQANSQVERKESPKPVDTLSLTGLGIHYTGVPENSESVNKVKNASTSNLDDILVCHSPSASTSLDLSLFSTESSSHEFLAPKSSVLDRHAGYSSSGGFSPLSFLDCFNVPYADFDLRTSGSLSSVSTTQSSERCVDFLQTSSSVPYGNPYLVASGGLDDMLVYRPSFGPFPDINMYNMALFQEEPKESVNPLDIFGEIPILSKSDDDITSQADPQLLVPELVDNPRSPSPAKCAPLSETIQDIVSILSASVMQNQSANEECPQKAMNWNEVCPQEQLHLVCENASGDQPSSQLKTDVVPIHSDFTAQYTLPTEAYSSTNEVYFESIDHLYPSPILNAHLGVDLDELVFRAERYRARRPGEEIDKQWLMHFAGKLSERGELLEDFRCYVTGCDQVNRRRDHILVHVGSHVDQRPFRCGLCPMRFLRKNECKRHEASHTGDRPFCCAVCLVPRSFVRQDLLKRHMKRTHGITAAPAGKGYERDAKRAKFE